MKLKAWLVAVPMLLIGVLAIGLLPGCEVGSVDDVVPSSSGNFSGLYAGPSGSPLVAHNSGNAVNSLNLSQYGNQLQAVDNNGILFKGTLGDIVNSSATFSLDGTSTAGAQANISGTLHASGSTASMVGTWTEPSIYSAVNGTASITPIPTNSPVTNTNAMLRIRWNPDYLMPFPVGLWFMRTVWH